MRKIVAIAAAVGMSTAVLAGCGSSDGSSANTKGETGEATTASEQSEAGFPVTVQHAAGETTIESEPETIVVLNMAGLDTVHALGVGDKVVGTVTKSIPSWLQDDYADVTDVGSFFEPDEEAIAKLHPDLVIIGNRSAQSYEAFKDRYPTIDASVKWDEPDYAQQVMDSIMLIGQATGATEAAAQASQDVADAVAKYTGAAEGKGTAMLAMVSGGEVSMHGPKSRWSPIWDIFGFEPIQDDAKADEGHKGQKISFETLKELNPDWLFVVDRDAAVGEVEPGTTAEVVLDNDLVNATTAAKEDHSVYIDPERWYIVMTGAKNFIAELDEIGDALGM
ncbi:MAG: ABC transporter substrate-binding protein [Bowdeniella nasicola]|nr:ABC transporter substrate-binding protein [Bowdeniella nasicola]